MNTVTLSITINVRDGDDVDSITDKITRILTTNDISASIEPTHIDDLPIA
jgi:hypothetical protein